MLTSQLAIARYDFTRRRIYPDRLTQQSDAHYVPVAQEALEVYRQGIGRTRRQLHQDVETVFEQIPDCPTRRIAAFAKLLDDQSDFHSNRKAADLRREVFRAAAKQHPLVKAVDRIFENSERETKGNIAAARNTTWPEIERDLFADVMEFHRLKTFPGYDSPQELLARYNVAQVQACLYRAERMTLWAKDDLQVIVRSIKLSRLMHYVERTGRGDYRFVLDGPASVLRRTNRYGVAMARMIPTLLSCRNWRFKAPIAVGNARHLLSLQLSCDDGLRSPKPIPDEFDSEVERDLMQKWEKSPQPEWTLCRESEILHSHQKVFIPDFVAEHSAGKRVYVEIVGYWTPEYIQAKIETLRAFASYPILIVVQADKKQSLQEIPANSRPRILEYKTVVSLKQFASHLQALAEV